MEADLWSLYKQMLRSRTFELAVIQLWEDGLISGEMHLGIGEEAIVAGIVDQLEDGDALALDHRGTPPLVMRGIDLEDLLQEFLGHPDGLCGGMGGHMHLFSRQHLAASSGIVGASGPAATGFALAGQYLRPGKISVAFFGEGAMNQGMLMESMNLAVVWKLPVLFVCKDDEWAITTQSPSTRGGKLIDRANGFGMHSMEIDGTDVEAVWQAANEAISYARSGRGPVFLHAHCIHIEGHMITDPLLRIARHPVKELSEIVWPQVKAFFNPKGIYVTERLSSVRTIVSLIGKTMKEQSQDERDPLLFTRKKLDDENRLQVIEGEVAKEIEQVVEQVLGELTK